MKLIKGKNDLATTHPALALEWDYEKNKDVTPCDVSRGTEKKFWWKCSKCGQSWEISVYNRTHLKTNCPYCAGQKVAAGVNDLKSQRPDLVEEWDYEKNEGLSPETISVNSSKKVHWICKKGHTWITSVSARTAGKGTRCPKCQTGLHTSFPELCIFYYTKQVFPESINRFIDKENGIPEIDIYIPSLKIGVEYNGIRYHVDKDDESKKRIIEKKGITLISIFETEEKGNLLVKGNNIYINERASFNDLNSLVKTLFERFYKIPHPEIDSDSDALKIYKLQSYLFDNNSLAVKFPTIAQEWDYERNEGLTPYDFSYSSHMKVWWKCSKCGQSWRAVIGVRTKEKKSTSCPYCSNQKVAPGINDFESKRPLLALDWDHEANYPLRPNQVTEKSNKPVFWKCHRCGKRWQMSPNRRCSVLCPGCRYGKRSGGEKKKVKNTDNGMVFESVTEAAKWLGDSKCIGALCNCLSGRTKTCRGYHWSYLD